MWYESSLKVHCLGWWNIHWKSQRCFGSCRITAVFQCWLDIRLGSLLVDFFPCCSKPGAAHFPRVWYRMVSLITAYDVSFQQVCGVESRNFCSQLWFLRVPWFKLVELQIKCNINFQCWNSSQRVLSLQIPIVLQSFGVSDRCTIPMSLLNMGGSSKATWEFEKLS